MAAFDASVPESKQPFNGYFWLAIAISCIAASGLVYGSIAVTEQHNQVLEDQKAFERAIERHMTYRNFSCSSTSYGNDALLRKLNNQTQPLSPDYVPPQLVEIPYQYRNPRMGNIMVREEVLGPLQRMIDDAYLEGVVLRTNSAYRSFNEQVQVYETFSNTGETAHEGHDRAARSGYSEHQLGTAVDLSGYPTATQEAYDWLLAHAHEYGFVLSYPDGAEAVTEYLYEPWHWRYVGDPIAQHIKANNILYNHEQALLLPSPVLDGEELAYEYTGRDIWVWKYREHAQEMEAILSGWQDPDYMSDIRSLAQRFEEGRIAATSTTITMPQRDWVLTDDALTWRDAAGNVWYRTVLASPLEGTIERLEVLYRADMGYMVVNYQTEEAGDRLIADLARTCS